VYFALVWTVFDYRSGGGTEMQVSDQSLIPLFTVNWKLDTYVSHP